MDSMDELQVFSSSTEQTLRERNVPEDTVFVMNHLNDPNYDLRSQPHSITSVVENKDQFNSDAESQFNCDGCRSSPAESTPVEFDRYVCFNFQSPPTSDILLQ